MRMINGVDRPYMSSAIGPIYDVFPELYVNIA